MNKDGMQMAIMVGDIDNNRLIWVADQTDDHWQKRLTIAGKRELTNRGQQQNSVPNSVGGDDIDSTVNT